jgi:hypothetical protein
LEAGVFAVKAQTSLVLLLASKYCLAIIFNSYIYMPTKSAKTPSPRKTAKVQPKRRVRSASPISKSTRKRLAQHRPKTPSPKAASPKAASRAAFGNPGKTPTRRIPYVPPHKTLANKVHVWHNVGTIYEHSVLRKKLNRIPSAHMKLLVKHNIGRELREMMETDVMLNDAQFWQDFNQIGVNHDTDQPTGELFKPSKRHLRTDAKPKPSHIWKITGVPGTEKRGDNVKYGQYVEERFEELIYELEDNVEFIIRLAEEKYANQDYDSKLIPAVLEQAAGGV